MKHAMTRIFKAIMDEVYKKEKMNVAYLIYIPDSGVLHCSEEDIKSPTCRRMIGAALLDRTLYAPLKAVDPQIATSSVDFRYRAILATAKGEISIFNLTKNRGESHTQYLNYFKNEKDPEKRFVTGIMGSTRENNYWYPVSKYHYRYNLKNGAELLNGAHNDLADLDVRQLLAEVMQEKFSAFTAGAKDEKEAKLQTMKQLRDKQEAAFKKFKSIWKGTGDQLHKAVWMFIIKKDRRSRAVGWYGAKRHPTNLQQQFAFLA